LLLIINLKNTKLQISHSEDKRKNKTALVDKLL